jgi:hypothetical protein
MQMSNRRISRLFKKFPDQAPQIPVKNKTEVHLLFDGTYLPNGLCLILYYEAIFNLYIPAPKHIPMGLSGAIERKKVIP